MNLVCAIDDKKSFPLCQLDVPGVDKLVLSFDKKIDEVIDYLSILGKSVSIIDQKYEKMRHCLKIPEKEIVYALPQQVVHDKLQNISEMLTDAVESTDNKEYLVTYLSIKRFLRSLSAPIVDIPLLQEIIQNEKHQNVASRMAAFIPKEGNTLDPTKYSMTGTVTGRLTVESGPQILTLNSHARKCFKSRFKNGKVLQIDLTAAEPNIALKAAGVKEKSDIPDVYEYLTKNVLDGTVSRDVSKLVTLCVLYGQSPKNLEKKLPSNVNASSVIRKTREFFEISYLEKTLRNDFRNKRLKNILGRPIFLKPEDERLCVNYYLQSSAAELSIILFSEWTKRHPERAVPLYVIHDALIVDCDEALSDELIAKESIDLSVGTWIFKSKVTKISDN